jgi:hypothetical protein
MHWSLSVHEHDTRSFEVVFVKFLEFPFQIRAGLQLEAD